jgi:hypothetical protein
MDVIIVFLVLLGIYQIQIDHIVKNYEFKNIYIDKRFLNNLFFVHTIFYVLYLFYSYYNRSDSGMYYVRAQSVQNWGDLFQTGTMFIDFVNYPFARILRLSYYSVMLVFSFFGFQGLLLLYLTGKEHITNLPIKYAGFTMLELLFLLPNTHFWSASIGKGSVMVLGIGLFFYGLSRFNTRILHLFFGGFLIYMVRKHVLTGIIFGIGVGLLFGDNKINKFLKFILACFAFVGFFFVYNSLMEETGFDFTDENNESLEHLSSELAKSNSGVDINNYNQFFKLFTFLFRPLFVDAPNLIGLFTSIEDLLCLILTFQMIKYLYVHIKKVNSFFVILIISFLVTALALAQITGNLGIAVRQKAQIFPLFFLFYAKVLSFTKFSKA